MYEKKYIITESKIRDINDCIRNRETMQIKGILKELPILEEKIEIEKEEKEVK